MGQQYFYVRVSTTNQNFVSQVTVATDFYPNAEIVTEIVSGAKETKPKLDALVDRLEPGDQLVVFGLDRLSRRLSTAIKLIEKLKEKKVGLFSHREKVDFSSATGQLVLNIMFSVAQMERELISERVKAGLAASRAKGRIGGRPRTKGQNLLDAKLLVEQGFTVSESARKSGISRQYLTKYLNSLKPKKVPTDTPDAGGTKVG